MRHPILRGPARPVLILALGAAALLAPVSVHHDRSAGWTIGIGPSVAHAKGGREGGDDKGGDDRGDDKGDDDKGDDKGGDRSGGSDDGPEHDAGDDSGRGAEGRSGSDDSAGDRGRGRGSDDGAAHDAGDDHGDDHGGLRAGGMVAEIERSARGVEVSYSDGWSEEIENGRYELRDARRRTVVERPATAEDRARLGALR